MTCSTNNNEHYDYEHDDNYRITHEYALIQQLFVQSYVQCIGHRSLWCFALIWLFIGTACPSCFPSCASKSLTLVPTCSNPTFTSLWCVRLDHAFMQQSCHSLQCACTCRDLGSNYITSIPSGVFTDLGKMIQLYDTDW